MLDQSFSAQNFRTIFDLQNRRGNFVEADYFPEIKKITDRITDCNAQLRALRKEKSSYKTEDYLAHKKVIYEKRDGHREKKEELLTKTLQTLSKEVSSNKFMIELRKVTAPDGSAAYALVDTPHAFFVMKQLQHNINRLYGVKQSNRFEILCQLKSLLSDDFPKELIRTDFKGFYESIPTKRLLDHIDKEPLLSISSKKFVHQVIRQYQRLSGSEKGIPRGVGISAYLAEIYTRQFDQAVKSDKACFFYARYVDDIVIMYLSPKGSANNLRMLELRRIAKSLDLQINMGKTFVLKLPEENAHGFSYLGFEIVPSNSGAQFEFTAIKASKYNKRIFATFEEYRKRAKLDEKKARKLLVKRVRFLTGNTRLLNNKRNALVGIHFSNRLLNRIEALEKLDMHLKFRIRLLDCPPLENRLKKMSFVEGFRQKRFARYSTESLKSIVGAWKYEA